MVSAEEPIDLFKCTDEECKRHTRGIGFEQIIRLLGVYGIEPGFDFRTSALNKELSVLYYGTGDMIRVKLKTKHLSKFEVQIRISGKRITICNIEKKPASGRCIALKLLVEMLNTAAKLDFKRVDLWALGGKDYDGVIVWGLLGFTPIDFKVVEMLDDFREKTGASCLYELLITDEGRNLWLTHVTDWDGEFLLDDPLNVECLKKAISRKGLDGEGVKLLL
jgi:hypothetical protein